MRIVKKYKTASSESIYLETMQRMTKEDANVLAENEIALRRQKVDDDYDVRVGNIYNMAAARGLQHSSIVVELLDRAFLRKTAAHNRLDGLVEKLAKKIFAENQKLAIATEKEKTMARTRALRDYISLQKMKVNVPYNAQDLIYEDTGNQFLEWLFQYPSLIATGILNDNQAYFTTCMGVTKYNEIKTKVV
jgi:hypothetical protein